MKILIVLSEWGYWGEELVGPLNHFDAAGYEVVFITPTGKKPKAISVSMDPKYIDPPLSRPVTSKETEFATKIGVTYSTVNRWENNKGKLSPSAMLRIEELQNKLEQNK